MAGVQADPYGGQYVTAGDPAVDVNGNGIESRRSNDPGGVQSYYNTYGTLAPQVWAEDQNRILLASGQAIMTSRGLISLAAATSAVQAQGYKGPVDAASVAQAYQLLIASPPSSSTSAPAAASIGGGRITLPLVGSVPTVAAAAIGVAALYMLMGRRR